VGGKAVALSRYHHSLKLPDDFDPPSGGFFISFTGVRRRIVTLLPDRDLMENASAVFLDAVRKSMRTIRTAIGARPEHHHEAFDLGKDHDQAMAVRDPD
jgi:hypothetical protein